MRYPLKNWKRIKRGYKFGEKTFYSSFHLGTDYLVPVGTPVYAPHSCEIARAGNFLEGGKTIHAVFSVRGYGRVVARFMHLSRYVARGKYGEGAIIGYTGNTGKLTKGSHLHLDISRGSVKTGDFKNFLDPEKFFSKIHTQPAPKSNIKKLYYLYILECADKTLYTGITTDLGRRIAEHNDSKLGSKYTSARRPVRLVYSRKFKNRSAASREEARIKKLKKPEKLELIERF